MPLLMVVAACGAKPAPADPSDVKDVRVTVVLRLTEIQSPSPKSLLSLVLIDERGETTVKEVKELQGICTPEAGRDGTELSVVSCWWRDETIRVVASRKGKHIEVRSADKLWDTQRLPPGAVTESIKSRSESQ